MKNFSTLVFLLLFSISSFSDAQNMSQLNPNAYAHTTSQFGLKGNVKSMEVIAFSEKTYVFNPAGMLTKEESRYGSASYNYDSKNHLSKITYGDPDIEPTIITTDSKGNIVHFYDSESNQRFYEYNDKNQLLTVKFGKEKTLDYKYKYDVEGRLIQAEEYSKSDVPETIRVNEYIKTENGWIVTNTSTDSSSGQEIIATQVYNANGDLVKSEYSNSRTVNSFKFEYDEKGNYIEAYMDDEEDPTEERIFIYY